MPIIRTEFRNFGKGRPSGDLDIEVTLSELLRTAAVVGIPTVGSTLIRHRPQAEMDWRVGIVEANIQVDVSGTGWTRTAAYDRLDPSEKSAVSYFLGMVSAAVTTRAALAYPHLVHVDELLRQQHPTVTGKRPDFVAANPAGSPPFTATVEAKGRTNGFDQPALTNAKTQALKIPKINGLNVRESIASEAFFDDAVQWRAVLDDPDWEGPELDVGLETYLVTYYRTVIDSGRESDTWERVGNLWQFTIPRYPLTLTIPAELVDAYDQSAAIDELTTRDVTAHLTTAYRQLAESATTAPGTDATDMIGIAGSLDDVEAALTEVFLTATDD